MPAPRSIAVIGAGPGGLYVARLLKRARPDWRVCVYERNSPGMTFGFGVGLTPATMSNLAAADPESAGAVASIGWKASGMQIRVDPSVRTAVRIPDRGTIAVGRAALLDVLARCARQSGVELVTDRRARAIDIDADVVIAADGAASATRAALAGPLGARVEHADGHYLWCGAPFALPETTFALATDAGGSAFVMHAYPYARDRSTFLFEVDHAAWIATGMDRADELTHHEPSDHLSIGRLGALFSTVLEGRPLMANRSRWKRFATVACRRWHHGKVVLLGDAAHTAHYSIGSGTKLALEDAIELAARLASANDPTRAFEEYETARRPVVERFQALAGMSSDWWDGFPRRAPLGAARSLCSFLTRTGSIDIEAVFADYPELVRDAADRFAGERPPVEALRDLGALTAWSLTRPLTTSRHHLRSRVVHRDRFGAWRSGETVLRVAETAISDAAVAGAGSTTASLIASSRRLFAAGHDVVWLSRAADEPEMAGGRQLTQAALLAFAESVRLEAGGPVGVDVAGPRSYALMALITGRVDLVRFRTQERSLG